MRPAVTRPCFHSCLGPPPVASPRISHGIASPLASSGDDPGARPHGFFSVLAALEIGVIRYCSSSKVTLPLSSRETSPTSLLALRGGLVDLRPHVLRVAPWAGSSVRVGAVPWPASSSVSYVPGTWGLRSTPVLETRISLTWPDGSLFGCLVWKASATDQKHNCDFVHHVLPLAPSCHAGKGASAH